MPTLTQYKETLASNPAGNSILHTLEISHPESAIIRDTANIAFVVDRSGPRVNQETQLDIVFCVDTTGSMSSQLATIVSNITEVASSLSLAFIDVKYALVSFKDEDETAVAIDFSDFVDFEPILSSLTASGGDDTPESGFGAVKMACDSLSWRGPDPQARVIIVLTDTNSHERGASYLQAKEALSEKSVILCSNYEGITEPGVSYSYAGLIQETGGQLLENLSAKEIINSIYSFVDLTYLTAIKEDIINVLDTAEDVYENRRYSLITYDNKYVYFPTGLAFTDRTAFQTALIALLPIAVRDEEKAVGYDAIALACSTLNWNLKKTTARAMILCGGRELVANDYTKNQAKDAIAMKAIRATAMHRSNVGYDFDLIVTVTWEGHPDLDIKASCFSRSVGYLVGLGDGYLRWMSQDSGESEKVGLSIQSARDASILGATDDVSIAIGFGWYESASASPGTNISISVTSRDGRTANLTFDGSSETMQTAGVSTTSKTITVPYDTNSAISIT